MDVKTVSKAKCSAPVIIQNYYEIVFLLLTSRNSIVNSLQCAYFEKLSCVKGCVK